jgi:chromosome segregation ATPase
MRERTWKTAVVIAPLLVAIAGCASKQDLDKAKADAAACQAQLGEAQKSATALQALVAQCQQDVAAVRGGGVAGAGGEFGKNEAVEMHNQADALFESIQKALPDAVKQGVAKDMEKLRGLMTTVLKSQEAQLAELQAHGATLKELGISVDSTRSELASKITELQEHQKTLADLHQQAIQKLQALDERFDCKNCPDKLNLTRKNIDAILKVHGEIVQMLAQQ